MFPSRTLALMVSASLFAGCAVGPDYRRPEMPLPERYQSQSAIQQRNATRPADFAVWWEGFNDALLSRLVSDALAQNLDLAKASARLAQAGAGLGAATAALLLSGNISGQASRAYQSVETPLGQVLNSTPDYNRYGSAYEADVNVGWEIDVFGGLRRGRQSALTDYQASEADVAAKRLTVAASSARIGVTISEYYPTFSLSALLGSATAVSGGNLFSQRCQSVGRRAGTSLAALRFRPHQRPDRPG